MVIVDNVEDNVVNGEEYNLVGNINFTASKDTGKTYFVKENEPKNPSYRILNYFYNTPFEARKGEFNISKINKYNITLNSGETVNINENYSYGSWDLKLYSTKENAYVLLGVLSSDGFDISPGIENNTYCILKGSKKCSVAAGEFGKGRFVWINNYSSFNKINNVLLKSSILWASGEKYQLIPGKFREARLGGRYFSIPFFMYDTNPYTLKLNIGLIFT